MPDIQFESPKDTVKVSGGFEIREKDSMSPTQIMRAEDKWIITATIHFKSDWYATGKMVLDVFYEALGPGDEGILASLTEELMPKKEQYDFLVPVNIRLSPGVYRVGVIVRILDEKGSPTPIVGFSEGGLIQVYQGL